MNRDRNDQKSFKYNDEVVAIKRVSKTVKGGRTVCFSALVIVGDGKGKVGVGLGKAGGVPEAIRKDKEAAMKNIVTVAINENKNIPHDFTGEYGSVVTLMRHAPGDIGVIAGGPARAIVELVGIQNIRTKSFGSSNKTNIVLTMLEGLKVIRSPEEITRRHGKSVEGILG